MGFKEFKQKRKESKAFKGIVAKRTLQARRKAFADESIKEAIKEGHSLARRKKGSFGKTIFNIAKKSAVKFLSPRTSTTPKRKAVRRKAVRKKVYHEPRETYEREPPKPAGFEWM